MITWIRPGAPSSSSAVGSFLSSSESNCTDLIAATVCVRRQCGGKTLLCSHEVGVNEAFEQCLPAG